MQKTLSYSLLAGLVCAVFTLPVDAAERKLVTFSIDNKNPEVSGLYTVNGYSPAEIQRLIGKFCTSGKGGQIALQGKPRKKKGQVVQKYTSSCAGGAAPRFPSRRVSVQIEQMADGKHVANYLTSDGKGNILSGKETVKP